MTFDEALQILAAFEREKVDYVLIGSMAMAAQGVIRATRDVDFFVSPESENVERLKRALKSVFDDDANVDEITAADLGGDYPAIEYTPPHGRFSLDILSRLGEAWRFEDLESEVLVVDDVSIRVATPAQIYRMKKDTVRPQDRLDAATLRERFDLSDED
ncbi:MAG TPA: nucleotidyl transferase AbiEii/AbiGii toxin family protein [Vicinamibacteria bacterium]|nr:nucleotidyl transferase AbiEii/AbiGii toxin family protein [Vicinamibacteria bacterium]